MRLQVVPDAEGEPAGTTCGAAVAAVARELVRAEGWTPPQREALAYALFMLRRVPVMFPEYPPLYPDHLKPRRLM